MLLDSVVGTVVGVVLLGVIPDLVRIPQELL
jgi:hypothetical protein